MPTGYQSSILLSQRPGAGNYALETRNAGPGVAFPGPVRLAEMLKNIALHVSQRGYLSCVYPALCAHGSCRFILSRLVPTPFPLQR